jgi:hypothetical protein
VRAGCAVAPTLTVARVGVDGTLEQRTAQREIRGRAGRALLVSKQRVRGKPCLGVGLGLGLGLGLGEGQSSQGWTATYHLLAADDLPIGLHTTCCLPKVNCGLTPAAAPMACSRAASSGCE